MGEKRTGALGDKGELNFTRFSKQAGVVGSWFSLFWREINTVELE